MVMPDNKKIWFKGNCGLGLQLVLLCSLEKSNLIIKIWVKYEVSHFLNNNYDIESYSLFAIGSVRKIGSFWFYSIFWRKTKLLVYQWQAAVKTAQMFDPYDNTIG